MKITLAFLLLSCALAAHGQKTNETIARQIKSLKADKDVTLSFDAGASKIMATAGNFDDREASKAGIQAMNFGMAFFYPGKELVTSPESINLTFWVLTKQPRFAAAHKWTAMVGGETLDLGDARYTAKSGSGMEYLNFKIARPDLAKIAGESNVKFKLGTFDFTFTDAQLTLFKNILAVSDSR
jgi:hypothetical protein